MNKLAYRRYLQSPHWREFRVKALIRAEFRCQVCNAKGQLDVHHRDYSRLGEERLADVCVLCRSCHAKFHGQTLWARVVGWGRWAWQGVYRKMRTNQ